MSTRATYLFKASDDWGHDTCIYIHHDGYEAGGAYYLYNAFKAQGSGYRLTAEGMIRGNERAEITQSHEAHGDTEYRYTIHKQHLIVEAGYDDKWRQVYSGDWIEFVNKHYPRDWGGDFKRLKRIKLEYSEQVYSPDTLVKQMNEDIMTLGGWAAKGDTESWNAKSVAMRIRAAQSYLVWPYSQPTWGDKASDIVDSLNAA